ncbi:hypothetical protein BH09BAC5_BH09BAC5_24330 [soil metagenome]
MDNQINSSNKPIRAGYKYGKIFLIIGLVLVIVNVAMLLISNSYFPKMLVIGTAIAMMSLSFFVFPGAKLEKMPEGKDLQKVLFKTAPTSHKVVWIVWGLFSIAVSVIGLIQFDPEFFK